MKKAIEILNEQIAKTNELLMLVETEYEEQYVKILSSQHPQFHFMKWNFTHNHIEIFGIF